MAIDRGLFQRWTEYDDEQRSGAAEFASSMLADLPNEVAPAVIGPDRWADKESALTAFDEYNSLPDSERASDRGKKLASELKAYIGPQAKQQRSWVHPNEYQPDRGNLATGQRMGLLESLTVPFAVGMADFGGAMLKGVDPFVPGDGPVQEFMTMAGEWLQNVPSAQAQADSARMQSMPMWIAHPDKPWTEEIRDLPDVINGWAAKASANAGLMVYGMLGGMVGAAVAGAAIPAPEELVTGPAGGISGAALAAFAGRWVGNTVPMIAIEASGFLEQAQEIHGIPKATAEKYARIYGTGSGVIEGIQQMAYIKQLKGSGMAEALVKQKDALLKKMFLAMGDMAWEGGEEVTQGFLMNRMLARASEEALANDPTWTPKKGVDAYTAGQAKEEFALGAILGGIYKLNGNAIQMIKGEASEDTRTATYGVHRLLNASNVVRTQDLQTLGKNVGEVLMDPAQQEKQALRGKVKKGSIFEKTTQRTEDNGNGTFEFLRDEYAKLVEGVTDQDQLDAANLELGQWLAQRFGIIEAENFDDFTSLSEAIKTGDLKRKTAQDRRVVAWVATPEFSRTENGLKLANSYGLALEISEISDITKLSENLTNEQIDDDDFMHTFLSQKRGRAPEDTKRMVATISAARDAGLYETVAKAPLMFGYFTEEQINKAGYGKNYDPSSYIDEVGEDGTTTRKYGMSPRASVHADEAGNRRFVVSSEASLNDVTEDVLELVTREDMLQKQKEIHTASGDAVRLEAVKTLELMVGAWKKGTKEQLQKILSQKQVMTPAHIRELGKEDKAKGVYGEAPREIVADLTKRQDVLFDALSRYMKSKDADPAVNELVQKSLNKLKESMGPGMTYVDAATASEMILRTEGLLGNMNPMSAFAMLDSISTVELLSKAINYELSNEKKAKESPFGYTPIPKEMIDALVEAVGPELGAILQHGSVEDAPSESFSLKVDLSAYAGGASKAVQSNVEAPAKAAPKAEDPKEETPATPAAETPAAPDPAEQDAGAPVDESPDAEDQAALEEAFNEQISYAMESFRMDGEPTRPGELLSGRKKPANRPSKKADPKSIIASRKNQTDVMKRVKERIEILMRQVGDTGMLNYKGLVKAHEMIKKLLDKSPEGLSYADVQKFLSRRGQFHPDAGSTMGISQYEMEPFLASFIEKVDVPALIESYKEIEPLFDALDEASYDERKKAQKNLDYARREIMRSPGILLENTTTAEALGIKDEAVAALWDALPYETRIAAIESFGQDISNTNNAERLLAAETFIDALEGIKAGERLDSDMMATVAKVIDVDALRQNPPVMRISREMEAGYSDTEIHEAFMSLPIEAQEDVLRAIESARVLDPSESTPKWATSASAMSEPILSFGSDVENISDKFAEATRFSDQDEAHTPQAKADKDFVDHQRYERERKWKEDRIKKQIEEGFTYPDTTEAPLIDSTLLIVAHDPYMQDGMAKLLHEIVRDSGVELVPINNIAEKGKQSAFSEQRGEYYLEGEQKKRQVDIKKVEKVDYHSKRLKELPKANPATLTRAAAEFTEASIVFFSTTQFDKAQTQAALGYCQMCRTGRVPPVSTPEGGLFALRQNDWDMLGQDATAESGTFRSVLPLNIDTLSNDEMVEAIRGFIKGNSARRMTIVGNLTAANVADSHKGNRLRTVLYQALMETGPANAYYREAVNPRSFDNAGFVELREDLIAAIGNGSEARLMDAAIGNEAHGIKGAFRGKEAEVITDIDQLVWYIWNSGTENAERRNGLLIDAASKLEDSERYHARVAANPQSNEVGLAQAATLIANGKAAVESDLTYDKEMAVADDLLGDLANKDFLTESIKTIKYQNFDPKIAAKYIYKRDEILLNPKLLRQKYNSSAWMKPQVEGVPPFPENAFQTYGEWFAFAAMHEMGHRAWDKLGLRDDTLKSDEANAGMESVINGWAYDKVVRMRKGGAEAWETNNLKMLSEAIDKMDLPKDGKSVRKLKPMVTNLHEATKKALLDVASVAEENAALEAQFRNEAPRELTSDTPADASYAIATMNEMYDSWEKLPQLAGGLELRKTLMTADREKRAQVNDVLRKLQNITMRMDKDGIPRDVGMTLATVMREGITEEDLKSLNMSKDMQAKIKKLLEEKPEAAARIAEETKTLLDDMFKSFNDLSREMVGDEFIKFYRENYIPHLYIAKRKAAGGQKTLSTAAQGARVFETFVEAEKAGYLPLSLEADKLIARYAEMNYSMIAHKTLLAAAPTIMASDGDPMVIARYATSPDERVPRAQRVTPTFMNRFANGRNDYVRMVSPFAGVQEYWVHPDAANTMKYVLQGGIHGRFQTAFNGVMRFNNWAKFSALGLSLFHHFSLTESFIAANGGPAAFGFGMDAATFGGRVMMRQTSWQKHLDAAKIEGSPEASLADEFIRSGLIVNTAPNYDKSQIEVDLDHFIARGQMYGSRSMKVAGAMVRAYREWTDKHLWQSMLPGMKLYTASRLLDKYEGMTNAAGIAIDRAHVMEQISSYVNYAFGGIEFEKYMAVTPNVKKFLSLALFAPDWTISNMNIADVANLGGGKGPMMTKEMRNTYWPWMAFVITAIPATVQALIYAGFSRFGDDEERETDRAFMLQNEYGKKFGIDVTPIIRLINPRKNTNMLKMDLGTAGRERHYISFGKQAREVGGLFDNPVDMFYGKSSMVARMAFEQITGHSGDWDMPWTGKNFWEGIPLRAASIGGKFMPMSLKSFLVDKRPSTLFAPSSKGMTKFKAEQIVESTLEAYADPTMWKDLTRGGSPEFVENLDDFAVDVADALRRNVGSTGTPADNIVSAAAGRVKRKYYQEFFEALNKGDTERMEEAAVSVIRLGGVVDSFNRSMDGKFDRNEGVEYTYEMKRVVENAVHNAERKLDRPVSSSVESRKLLRMINKTSGGSRHVEKYMRNYGSGIAYGN